MSFSLSHFCDFPPLFTWQNSPSPLRVFQTLFWDTPLSSPLEQSGPFSLGSLSPAASLAPARHCNSQWALSQYCPVSEWFQVPVLVSSWQIP